MPTDTRSTANVTATTAAAATTVITTTTHPPPTAEDASLAYWPCLFRKCGWSKCTNPSQTKAMITKTISCWEGFSLVSGALFKNYKWLIYNILCSIQQNKLEISIMFCLGTVDDQSLNHSSQTTVMIAACIFPFERAFLWYLRTKF